MDYSLKLVAKDTLINFRDSLNNYNLKNYSCFKLKKRMKVLSFDVGIVNLAYCILDSETNNIMYWEIIELTKKGNTFTAHIASSGIAELYLTLINHLDQRPHLLDTDIVVIEKQPSFNPKMRIVAGCLQTYFYIRGVVDRPVNPIKSVEFFSPKHKLKCYEGPALDISRNGKIVKGKYAQTKKMGIEIARVKLDEYNQNNWVDFFEKNKKKDDLSDCYLQALTYLLFKGQTSKKKQIVKAPTKASLKKQLKEFLDPLIKNCSVMEIMEHKYRGIHELEIPFELPEDISTFLSNNSMKKYNTLKYI